MRKSIIAIFVILLLASCVPGEDSDPIDTHIHEIQGCSHVSPLVGTKVSNVRGVVTHKISNGFYLQGQDEDELDCSSEGVFVFTRDFPSVMVGDLVMVEGEVAEFNSGEVEEYQLSQTEIINPRIDVIQDNYELPEPILLDDLVDQRPMTVIEDDDMADFDINQGGLDFYESIEAMLVEIDQAIVVGPKNEYNEIVVIPEAARSVNSISTQGALIETDGDQNPERLVIKLAETDKDEIRVGDQLKSPVIGIMSYSYGNYKLLSLNPIEINNASFTIIPFEKVGNGLSIATYNLENLSPYDSLNRVEEIARQIVEMLSSPDVLLLNEVMDDSGSVDDGETGADQNLQRLVNAIIDQGGPEYEFSYISPANNQDGGLAGGNIRSVLLYRLDQGVRLVNPSTGITDIAYQDGQFKIHSNPLRIGNKMTAFSNSRKPSVWLLEKNNQQFFVIGVHLISQGTNAPDWGSQQPPERPSDRQRIDQARALNEFIGDILSSEPDIPIFVVGDMNDDPWSESMQTLVGESLMSASTFDAVDERYSYIFEGNAQLIDQILINKNLARNIIQARYMHLNTYLNSSDQLSDHDPVVVEVEFE